MPEDNRSPTLRRRRLAFLLRQLRDASGTHQTADQVTKALGWSAGKLTRLERAGTKRIDPRDIDDLLDHYGVEDQQQRAELIALAKDARQRGWWSRFSFWGDPYVDFENEACALRTYEALVIPGLLQTSQYAAALVRGNGVRDPDEITKRVEARMERKCILERGRHAVSLWAVIDEAALHKNIGDADVMHGQLAHLLDATQQPRVAFQVLPDTEGAHAGMAGQFMIMDFPEPLDPSLVYLESAREARFLEDPEDLAFYENQFREICASALSTDKSAALIERYAERLTE